MGKILHIVWITVVYWHLKNNIFIPYIGVNIKLSRKCTLTRFHPNYSTIQEPLHVASNFLEILGKCLNIFRYM